MTQTTAITPYQKLKDLLRSEDIQSQFEQALGKQAGQFIAGIITCVNHNPQLKQAEPNSILVASLRAAAVAISLEPALGHGYLVPYRKKGVLRAEFQLSYKGMIQLALRSGRVTRLNVAEIYEGEKVIEDRITGDLTIEGERESDGVIGYLGFIRLINGFEKSVYWPIEKITAHKEKYSKGFNRADSAWQTSPAQMSRKTVLRDLLSKYAPQAYNVVFEIDPEAIRPDHDDEDDIWEGDGDIIDLEAEDIVETESELEPAL